jgi:uncharacterized iron-regulated membrane protein
MPSFLSALSGLRWRDVVFTLHLWLGLASGLLFTTVCASGFFLGLHPQLEARARSAAHAAPGAPVLPCERLVQAALAYGVPDRIEVPEQPESPWKFRTPRGHLYVNPQTGAVLQPLWGDSYNQVKKLHRWLLLDSKVGRPLTGAAALIYLALMASGLALWLSKFCRKPARGLRFQSGVGWKRAVYDAHMVLGIYALAPLALMAGTGLWWSYREPVKAAIYWALDGAAPPVAQAKKESKDAPTLTDLPYAKILQVAGQELPFSGRLRISLPAQGDTEMTVTRIRTPGFWRLPAADELTIEIPSAKVLERRPFAEKSRAERFTSLIFDLHSGNIWGDLTLLAHLLATLVGASLPLTGTLMWWNRTVTRRRRLRTRAEG